MGLPLWIKAALIALALGSATRTALWVGAWVNVDATECIGTR